MKIIKEIVDQIGEELDGAHEYARDAMMSKDEHPELARIYEQMSQDEMGHVSKLHGAVVEMINQYRREHGEPPSAMMAVYDYEHGKMLKRAEEIRLLQARIRDGM